MKIAQTPCLRWIGKVRFCLALTACLALTLMPGGCSDDDQTVQEDGTDNPPPPCPCGEAAPRTVNFAGYTWEVRASGVREQPGGNCFCNDTDTVWVDPWGRLHMRIKNRNGAWVSSELISPRGMGYGTYTFNVASAIGTLDRNVVLGMFMWDDSGPANGQIREIDIEVTAWSKDWGVYTYYSVQPVFGPDTESGRYDERSRSGYMPPEVTASTHTFRWLPNAVSFSSRGLVNGIETQLGSWTFDGNNPPRRANTTDLNTPIVIPRPTARSSIILNLWLFDADGNGIGDYPSNGADVEVVLDGFTFIPR